MSTGPAKGRYAVEYRLSMFAYVDMDTDPPTVTRVVVNDEDPGKPVHVEHDDGKGDVAPIDMEGAEGKQVIEAVDGPDAEWPSWEFGW